VRTETGLYLENQACNGLRLWAENFDEMVSMHPVSHGPLPDAWKPVGTIGPNLARIRLVPLPMAYRPDQFLRHYRATRALIRKEIARADFLSFSIGGLFGDWGSIACQEAYRAGRPFAVWTDRVESEVVRRTIAHGPWRRRVRARLEHRPMWWREKLIVGRATLGLFHGKETYDTYAPFCREPQLVHDIHVARTDHIAPDVLQAKIDGAVQGPLKIVYTGRATSMKGPQDWVEVLERLAAQGVDFEATWLGDGPDLPGMQARIATAGLRDRVRFTGFVADRETVLDHLRQAHVFLFCHKTPESPRCLIEALISATPIVGYDCAFARDLVSMHRGGRLVAPDDVTALVEAVAGLAQDRTDLQELIAQACADGAPFDQESVFRHRSEVIRRYL
jgi:glycosyltransferase involved in cell wall biosynthesis